LIYAQRRDRRIRWRALPTVKDLEQIFLRGHGLVDRCRHASHSTLEVSDVKLATDLDGEQLMRDVEGSQYGNALTADDLPAIADFAHFFVQILGCFQEVFVLLLIAGDTKSAVEDSDFDASPI
jgi:hypothetical protein